MYRTNVDKSVPAVNILPNFLKLPDMFACLIYTLKIGLKLHVFVLKIFGLAMPMRMSTFRQDFPQLIFQQGALKISYAY